MLSGCATTPSSQQSAELKAHEKTEDEATCMSYGVKLGTGAYAQCRPLLKRMRQEKIIAEEVNCARIKATIYDS